MISCHASTQTFKSVLRMAIIETITSSDQSRPRLDALSRPARNNFRVYVCPDPDEVAAAATSPDSAASTAPTTASSAADAGGGGGGAAPGCTAAATSGGAGDDGDGGGAVVLRTKPILHVQLKMAELLCLDWSPHDPDLLLAGASDGEEEWCSFHVSHAWQLCMRYCRP